MSYASRESHTRQCCCTGFYCFPLSLSLCPQTHIANYQQLRDCPPRWSLCNHPGWFGAAVTALVTSAKLSYVKPGYYWDWWRPLTTALLSQYFPGHSALLILAITPWVGAMSTDDGFGRHWGRNGEFCVGVGPVTRTAGILAYCMLA